ncbi:MAG: HEPN domain-containing protein [Gallionella sp.]|nr:HEPN domain-containing protein [Gallionella sp.]
MARYLVVKILDTQSIVLPSTLVYGSVELRSHTAESESEVAILRESAKSQRLEFDNYSICARIATIVEGDNINDAVDMAEDRFSEILDLKSIEFSISSIKTSNIGYIKNLDDGKASPIEKQGFSSSLSFVVHHDNIQCFDLANYVLSQNNDLSSRYLRSLHWARNAKHEKNKQIKVLFYWFSVEALFKESESDNIGGLIRLFLGFPNGKNLKELSISTLDALNSHPRYDYWGKKLKNIVEEIRVFRNNSVHSGFRSVDFPKNKLELYEKVMVYGSSRSQGAVQVALINNITTVSEFKEYVCAIFENRANLVNDIHNNIIFTLDEIDTNHLVNQRNSNFILKVKLKKS